LIQAANKGIIRGLRKVIQIAWLKEIYLKAVIVKMSIREPEQDLKRTIILR
jgi:hypothetical protein